MVGGAHSTPYARFFAGLCIVMNIHTDDHDDTTGEVDDWDPKAATVLKTAYYLTQLLHDPTCGGTRSTMADARARVRDEARDGMLTCLDTLESIIVSYAKCDEVQSLSAKYIADVKHTATAQAEASAKGASGSHSN